MIKTLLFVLAFCSSTVSAQSVGELMDRYDRAYASERYELALKTAEQILELRPDSAWWQFSTGALLARLERPDEALDHLQRCAELGFSGLGSFEHNTDLDSLRETNRFGEILDHIRTHANERMETFQAVALKHEPVVFVPEHATDLQRAPIIIALHGTGMRGQSMSDVLLSTAQQRGMVLVCPDALRPSGDGYSWTYRDESAWFVEHLINHAVNELHGDRERVYLIGFSQGANIALIMGQTDPDLFSGVIPICGHFEPQIARADRPPAPFYLLTGAQDQWKRTYTAAREAFEDLGGEVRLRVVPGMGHDLPWGARAEKEFNRAFDWLERIIDHNTTVP
jgi:phospholipase/carboxylesterase